MVRTGNRPNLAALLDLTVGPSTVGSIAWRHPLRLKSFEGRFENTITHPHTHVAGLGISIILWEHVYDFQDLLGSVGIIMRGGRNRKQTVSEKIR